MPGIPDAKWQTLIQIYLDSLNEWQRLSAKVRPGPGETPNTAKLKKVNSAYIRMKEAEQELQKYETEMGY